jgi:hypothetical protein
MLKPRVSPGCAVVLLLGGVLLPGGCEPAAQAIGPDSSAPSARIAFANGVTARASGGGHFHNPAFGVDVQFAFTAVQRDPSGDATGNFHFSATSLTGQAIDVHGSITCVTTDPENPRRAWMGGVITKNKSEHPVFTGETSQVGRDAWFRVVDYGEGANATQADRATMIFFEPAGGFTSAEGFCQSQLWFPDDRLTNALLNGNIQVIH